jgi:hypothetical protein
VHESTDFDRDAAARVLRRALELAERDLGSTPADVVSEQALVEAAEELGVDPRAVRRAAAEERLGVLAGSSHTLDQLVGPPQVSATRVVDVPAAELMELVDAWLRRNGTLRRRRLDQAALVAAYTRRSDLIAGVQRTARVVRGEEHLGRVRRLQVVVQPIDGQRSVVALVADLDLERTLAVTGGSSVAGVGSTVAAVEALSVTPWLWLGVPASVAAGVGVLRWRARSVPDVEAALQGVLDRVIALDTSPGVLADVRERLLAGLSRQRRTA